MSAVLALAAVAMLGHPAIPTYPEEGYQVAVVAEVVVSMRKMPEARAERIATAVIKGGLKHNLSPFWLLAVGFVESGWNWAVSGDCKVYKPRRKGCTSFGFGQIKPRSARARGGCPKCTKETLLNLETNVEVMATLWAYLVKKYKQPAVIYNCGFRCGKSRWTPAVRGYFRRLKQLRRKFSQCCTGC